MTRGWIVLVSGLLVVSGCVSDAPEDASATTSASSASASQGAANTTAPGSSDNTTNEPPVATMEADNVTGSIPLNVTFLLNATGIDGDDVTWTLVLGDGSDNVTGTALPANATHSYVLAGNFTALFEVSDGFKTSNVTAAINVTAAAGGAKQTHIITGSTVVPFPIADEFACLNDDLDGNIYDLAPAGPGWSYTLEPGDGSFGLYWYAGGEYDSKGEASGIVPEGMDQVEICNIDAAPDTDYTVTFTSP